MAAQNVTGNLDDTTIVGGDQGIVSGAANVGPTKVLKIENGGELANTAANNGYLTIESDPDVDGGLLVFEKGSKYTGGGSLDVIGNDNDAWDDDRPGAVRSGSVLITGEMEGLAELMMDAALMNDARIHIRPEAGSGDMSVTGDITVRQTLPALSNTWIGGALAITVEHGTSLTFEGNVDLSLPTNPPGGYIGPYDGAYNLYTYEPTDQSTPTDGNLTFEGYVLANNVEAASVGQGTTWFKDDLTALGQLELETYKLKGDVRGGLNKYDGAVKGSQAFISGNHIFNDTLTATDVFVITENSVPKASTTSIIIQPEVWAARDQSGSINHGTVVFNKQVDTGGHDMMVMGQTVRLASSASEINAGAGQVNVMAADKTLSDDQLDPALKWTLSNNGVLDRQILNLLAEGRPVLALTNGSQITASAVNVGLNGTLAVEGGSAVAKVNGDLNFGATSTLQLERSSTSVARLDVSGQVNITKGAALHIFTPGGVSGETGAITGRTILTAAGGLANDNVFSNPLFEVNKVNNQLVLGDFKGTEEVISGAAGGSLTTNYSNTAALLDRLLQSGSTPADLENRIIGNLEAISDLTDADRSKAEQALKQLVGEEALSAMNAAVDTTQRVSAVQHSRLKVLHEAGPSPSAGFGPTENRVWASAFGQWIRQKNSGRIYGYDYDAGGLALGYDREVPEVPGLTLGVSGAWSSGEIKNNDGRTKTDVDTYSLGLYGSYEFGGGFFVDGNLNYGHAQNDASTKLVLGGRKEGSFDSNSWQVGLNLGYTFRPAPEVRLIPSVGLQYIHIKQDGWREKIKADPNNLALAHWFGDSKTSFVEIPVNLRLNTTWDNGCGVLFTPELRLGGIFAADKPDSQLRMGFTGSGDSAKIYGIDPGKNRFLAGAGLKVQVSNNLDAFIDYDYEGRSNYQSHNASAGLGYSF